nr:F-box/FBD/LRR-repeat protein At1g13570-like [Ipomoea trifida]
MARRLKSVPDASRDLISELPLEVKDRILGCLRTPEAARTAMLSKHWNDVWLQHGQLVFDSDFLESVEQWYDGEGRTLVNVINNILFFRDGPVKKFTLRISYDDPTPQQSDFDRWCLFLSRNGVEELKICLHTDAEEYKLPFCLLSCRTIKQLIVRGPFIDLPVNACGCEMGACERLFGCFLIHRDSIVEAILNIGSDLIWTQCINTCKITPWLGTNEKIWSTLKARFSEADIFRVSDLHAEIHQIRHGDLTASAYFAKLKVLWDDT